jgi:16S rRNA (guanine966-N2)-methyltransferase
MMDAVNSSKAVPAEREARNSVRIIAGTWRGRRLRFPALPGLRPTPDRVRETLFNWLQHEIGGARCLDLFAGSGALGMEALSRGALECVFVEQAQAAARALALQLREFGGAARGRVVEMGAARFLRTPAGPGASSGTGPGGDGAGSGEDGGAAFDVLFLDPPYGEKALEQYVPLLEAGGWVRPGSLVYLEAERSAGRPVLPAGWELLRSKSAGEVGYHLARVQVRPRE